MPNDSRNHLGESSECSMVSGQQHETSLLSLPYICSGCCTWYLGPRYLGHRYLGPPFIFRNPKCLNRNWEPQTLCIFWLENAAFSIGLCTNHNHEGTPWEGEGGTDLGASYVFYYQVTLSMQCVCTEWLPQLESGFQGGQLTSQSWE